MLHGGDPVRRMGLGCPAVRLHFARRVRYIPVIANHSDDVEAMQPIALGWSPSLLASQMGYAMRMSDPNPEDCTQSSAVGIAIADTKLFFLREDPTVPTYQYVPIKDSGELLSFFAIPDNALQLPPDEAGRPCAEGHFLRARHDDQDHRFVSCVRCPPGTFGDRLFLKGRHVQMTAWIGHRQHAGRRVS